MKKLSESRVKRAEKTLKQRTEERMVTLDLNDNELKLLQEYASGFSLDTSRLVTQLVKNWIRAEGKE